MATSAALHTIADPTLQRSDVLTVASVAALAYMLGSTLHEGLGHGGACLLSGGRPLVLSSVHFECSADTRLVMAGGTLVNLLAGALFFVLGRLVSREYPRLKFFLWLSMAVNLFAGTGYFLFSGIGGIGDWNDFIRGLGPQLPWRLGLTVLGVFSYAAAAWVNLMELRPFVGSDERRYSRAWPMLTVAYFTGGTLMCIAGAFNPRGAILILISAAASTFGGSSGLLWATQWLKSQSIVPLGSVERPIVIQRSWIWTVVAVVTTIIFVVVLGPSIRFNG
ncbi:MAG TPA: hypothetical protein VJT08_19145 [Terriglobales bacterium]|nr:hypothetical protein [Terriglobales bacterium]